MKHILLILLSIPLGCKFDNQQTDKLRSPSSKYYLSTTVNRWDKSNDNYADVVIHLFNSAGQLKTSFNTKAGDFSKWAVGWDISNDTIILFSSDIGVHAWRIEMDSLKPIVLTDDIRQIAKELKAKKYSDNS